MLVLFRGVKGFTRLRSTTFRITSIHGNLDLNDGVAFKFFFERDKTSIMQGVLFNSFQVALVKLSNYRG